MDREEAERQRILAILQESDSDTELSDQDVCDEEDHLSERSISIDTEQDISESDDDDIPLSIRLHRNRSREEQFTSESSSSSNVNREYSSDFYHGKDGTKWYKRPFRQNVRTRTENIIHQLPGVVLEAKSAISEVECWNLFISEDMLQIILTHTNARIKHKGAKCVQPRKTVKLITPARVATNISA